jgi:hypothetical protein
MSDSEFITSFKNLIVGFAQELVRKKDLGLKQGDHEYIGCMTDAFARAISQNVAGGTDKLKMAFFLDLTNRKKLLAQCGTLTEMSLDEKAQEALEIYAASHIKTRAAMPISAHQ